MEFPADQSVQGLFRTAQVYSSENTMLVVGAALGTVVLAVSLWLVVRWIRRPMGARLKRALAKRDEIVVLMHPNPDPDAMACAIAVAYLAETVETDVTLQYSGQIRHQENRAFRTILDLELTRVKHVTDLASSTIVLVDHNTPRGFDEAERIEPYAVIDHHPGNGTGEVFTDKRTNYGACSTIVSEYFEELGATPVGPDEIPPEDEFVLPSDVATGLLYGIQSDTKHLTNGCSEAEFSACAYLYQGVDEHRLDRIANPQVSAEVLEIKSRAITEREVRGSFAVCNVGELSNVDAIPQAADELMHLEGVTAVVIYGQKEDTFHVSGRSRDDRVHMGKALQSAVSEIPGAGAGGHARMGGGQVPVESAVVAGGMEVSLWTNREFTDGIFDALNGNV
ncbi:DHH family phosphoesterase [Haladaptatus cibarius]|uniref:DHH family phosphoesterase n=1 Tax=Haladaptatus cibarius TaxID=453847 RepID=UPI000678780F|nr:bifunctional oligoribonuclease/PAP phosphatase NrnA [Haladaptatus cibarius]